MPCPYRVLEAKGTVFPVESLILSALNLPENRMYDQWK
jgi:hypothetical protein